MGVAVSQGKNQFDCVRCLPESRIENGCEQDSPVPERWEINGVSYQRCPVKLITAQTWLLIRLFRQYKSGFLPVAGGILDQSAVFLQAMEIIQIEIAGNACG